MTGRVTGRVAFLKPWEKTAEYDWVRTEVSCPLQRYAVLGWWGPRSQIARNQQTEGWQAPTASSFLSHGIESPE